MPELPEVETMCRGIAAVVGGVITAVSRPRSSLQPIKFIPALAVLRRRVVGSRIAAVARLGKRVILELDSADRIVIEPRMTGRVLLAQPPDRATFEWCSISKARRRCGCSSGIRGGWGWCDWSLPRTSSDCSAVTASAPMRWRSPPTSFAPA